MLGVVFLFSCGDDDEATTKCMECTSTNPDITIDGGKACEGDTDDDGNKITLADMEAAKEALEALGEGDVTCLIK